MSELLVFKARGRHAALPHITWEVHLPGSDPETSQPICICASEHEAEEIAEALTFKRSARVIW